ncbi:hypothetical protein PUN28_003254 [Cardiocondyla obscurior]|uniref:Uncharacterized protein n=1 Tax=Cardiocondyla obscurior TaxID=286306 RepID=A0AAW2GNG5_9HYME
MYFIITRKNSVLLHKLFSLFNFFYIQKCNCLTASCLRVHKVEVCNFTSPTPVFCCCIDLKIIYIFIVTSYLDESHLHVAYVWNSRLETYFPQILQG